MEMRAGTNSGQTGTDDEHVEMFRSHVVFRALCIRYTPDAPLGHQTFAGRLRSRARRADGSSWNNDQSSEVSLAGTGRRKRRIHPQDKVHDAAVMWAHGDPSLSTNQFRQGILPKIGHYSRRSHPHGAPATVGGRQSLVA